MFAKSTQSIMMNIQQKRQAIKAHNATPFKEGDIVTLRPPSPGGTPMDGCKVVSLPDGLHAIVDASGSSKRQGQDWTTPYKAEGHSYSKPLFRVPLDLLRHTTSTIGANPFAETTWRDHVQYLNYGICSVLSRAGIGLDGKPSEFSGGDFRMVFDPTVTDNDGNPRHYQRGSVWTLAQHQALLDTIYRRGDIGRIVLRDRRGGSCDVVDGRQRLETIVAFVRDELPDHYGNTFGGLSDVAQAAFMQHPLPTSLLPMSTTDSQVLDIFLDVNSGGTVVAPEHLKAVEDLRYAFCFYPNPEYP
jgi:Protein of unknown function DUF262